MRSPIPGLLAAAIVAAVACSCGGRTDMTTAPTSCAAAVSPASQHVSAGGGTFAAAVTVSPNCEWTAATDASWVTMMRSSGSGSGSAAYTVTPNTAANGRNARIRVGEGSIVVTQSPANCSYSVDPSSASMPASGGTTEFRLNTSDECTWSASASHTWISLGTTSGNGSRTLSASIAPNTAATPRSGSIQVEGQTMAISQAASGSTPDPAPGPDSCSFEVNPREQTAGAGGGRVEIRLTASREACGWTAQARDSWIQLERTSGSGSSTVAAIVAANDRPEPRVTTIQAGSRIVTVNQLGVSERPSCAVTLSPSTFDLAAAGDTVAVDVATDSGCAWQTAGRPAWIRQDRESGSGPARVTFTVNPNTSQSARSAVISIGNQVVTFSQGGACTYAVNPTSLRVGNLGGTSTVVVTTQPSCKWSVTDSAKWITEINPASGTGAGSVSFHVGLNEPVLERHATLQIETAKVEITQSAGVACEFALSAGSQNVPAAGGSVQFQVNTAEGCGWSASTKDSWIENLSFAGRGTGTVTARVGANAGDAERRGIIEVAGRTFSVIQAPQPSQPSCTYTVTWLSIATREGGSIPGTINAAAAGDTIVLSVKTGAACSWKHSAAPDWIADLPAGERRGSIDLKAPVSCNATGQGRRGSMTIAGQAASIVQPADPARCRR